MFKNGLNTFLPWTFLYKCAWRNWRQVRKFSFKKHSVPVTGLEQSLCCIRSSRTNHYTVSTASDRAESVVDKLTLGQVFLRVLRFPLSISFYRVSLRSYITWGWTKGSLVAAVQRHSPTQSTWTLTTTTQWRSVDQPCGMLHVGQMSSREMLPLNALRAISPWFCYNLRLQFCWIHLYLVSHAKGRS
jgi:hypothetical protein